MTDPRSNVPDVSVVIVSYETRELTAACVRSIRTWSGDLDVEIIVVDNCSTDGTSAALRSEFPQVTVIDAPVNGGFAYGNALGTRASTGRRILYLNPDSEIFAETLPAAIAALDSDPRLGMIGARVLLPDGSDQGAVIRFPSFRAMAANILVPASWQERSRLFGDRRYASLSPDLAHRVDAVCGCFMFARAEMVEQVGGMDPRFFLYGEEVEWARRIRRAGWEIAYRPEVRVMHIGGASSDHLTVFKAREMTRGQLLYFTLAEGPARARIAAALMVLRDLVRLPAALVMTGRSGAGRSGAGERLRAVLARLALAARSVISPPRGQPLPPGLD